MCSIIFYNNEEIETPKQLKEIININPVIAKGYKDIDDNTCLCQVDLEETFKDSKYNLISDGGDYILKLKDENTTEYKNDPMIVYSGNSIFVIYKDCDGNIKEKNVTGDVLNYIFNIIKNGGSMRRVEGEEYVLKLEKV